MSSDKEWIQKAHKTVSYTGESKYKNTRILVKTDLNLKLRSELLTEYQDPQSLDYLLLGFPRCKF